MMGASSSIRSADVTVTLWFLVFVLIISAVVCVFLEAVDSVLLLWPI